MLLMLMEQLETGTRKKVPPELRRVSACDREQECLRHAVSGVTQRRYLRFLYAPIGDETAARAVLDDPATGRASDAYAPAAGEAGSGRAKSVRKRSTAASPPSISTFPERNASSSGRPS
jgi:hypothetical protein